MGIELSNEVNEERYMVCCKTGAITPIDVVRESESGETVETAYGRRLRSDCKSHKIFFDMVFAKICSMKVTGDTDDEEFDYLLKRAGLRRG